MAGDTFMYFGFASNMNSKRMKANVPHAEFVSLGYLEDQSLVFRGRSSIWHGATANLRPQEGSTAWGVVWKIPEEDLPGLNRQEGVLGGLYRTIKKDVSTPGGKTINCLLYESTQSEEEGLPSQTYLQTIIDGAVEHNLAQDYVNGLKNIRTNGIIHDFPGNKENVV